MVAKGKVAPARRSPYSAAMTREQFLYYEMRTTAQLVAEGCNEEQIRERIIGENLYQYPTEKSLPSIVRCCLRRLKLLDSEELIRALGTGSVECSKQICLYALMLHYRLAWDFFVTVIGEKYRTLDYTYSKAELEGFFLCLAQQDETVARWSESTKQKLAQILQKILVDNGYLAHGRAKQLELVRIEPLLQEVICAQQKKAALAAFNCFSCRRL